MIRSLRDATVDDAADLSVSVQIGVRVFPLAWKKATHVYIVGYNS